jgi:hypothetical protein
MECSKLGGQWKVPCLVANGRWRRNTFSPLPFSPQQLLPKHSIFSFNLTILLYHGPKSLLTPSFPFLRSINYNCAPQCNKSSTPSLSPWFWLKIWPFLFLEIMASRMVTSYGPQATQTNEKQPQESSLDLTLTQHPRDEEPEPWEVCARFEVEPPRAWYYRISPNSRTLVILLQVDPTFGDEPETVCEGYYELEDTFIFAWFSVPGVGHYHWLRGPICWLPPNSKADYLVRTIRRILDFLQLWTITMA